MRRVHFTQGADANLAEIALYIAEQSGQRAVATAFTKRLRDKCKKLGTLPGTLGTARPELLPDIRALPFQGYVIFFRYREDVVEIVDILEGHRDAGGYYGEE